MISAAPSCTFSRTVLDSSSGGSCSSMPTLYPGDRNASPLEGCSRPAMILSTVDLPAPFGPDHTDLRAGQEAQRHVIEDDLVAVRLARLAHGVDVLSQEKPSGSLKSGSGQIHPILPEVHPSGGNPVQVGAADLGFRRRRPMDERWTTPGRTPRRASPARPGYGPGRARVRPAGTAPASRCRDGAAIRRLRRAPPPCSGAGAVGSGGRGSDGSGNPRRRPWRAWDARAGGTTRWAGTQRCGRWRRESGSRRSGGGAAQSWGSCRLPAEQDQGRAADDHQADGDARDDRGGAGAARLGEVGRRCRSPRRPPWPGSAR